MVARTTVAEKILLLGNRGTPIAGLGTESYNWWSEASTGIANWVERRGTSTETTKFAFPITTAMSFNRTLWFATGAQIGREGRALMNAGTVSNLRPMCCVLLRSRVTQGAALSDYTQT